MSLENKVAIVTGGSRGIGRSICLELAKRGAKIALTYVSANSTSKAEQVANEVRKVHKERGTKGDDNVVIAIQADAASMESPSIIINETLKAFNSDTINILINNAGVSINQSLEDVTMDAYDKTMDINVKGVIFLTQKLLPHLPKQGGGKIVNLSSVSSKAGFEQQTAYAAAKAGVEGLTKVWANELGPKYGITVNCINPGPVDTDMFNGVTDEMEKVIMDRLNPAVARKRASPQDIADIVAFLSEDKSRWVNGDVICANGGGLFT